VAKDGQGRESRATVTAESRFEALADLRGRGLAVLELQEAAGAQPQGLPRESAAQRGYKAVLGGRIGLGEKATFCRQISISVSSGVPLREAMESITEDVEHPAFKRILADVVKRLYDGKPFSEALAAHPAVFSRLFVSLIKTAEEAGSMPQTLEDLATSLEKTERLIRKVRTVTAYPTFIAAFFCIVVVVMTLFVLPQFQKAFTGFGAKLPLLTRMVFTLNSVMIHAFPYIVAALFLTMAFFVFYGRTRGGRLVIDGWKLRIPLFGLWLKKFAVARFCRNLAMMARGGVSISTALEIAAGTCGNRAMEMALLAARDRIMNGMSISASLAQEKIFPHLVLRMVSVGEATGRLPQVLEKVSDVYEDQVEGSIMTATALFEPIAICFFGAIILVIVLAIYLPVFTVASQIR